VSGGASGPHDAPDLDGLVVAVREFLSAELEPELEGRLRYQLKVAIHVLEIVERELRLGEEHRARHAALLERLGYGDDAELSAAIRSGGLDDDLDELARELRLVVADKLEVARPGYGT
jgi:hypothetical protein